MHREWEKDVWKEEHLEKLMNYVIVCTVHGHGLDMHLFYKYGKDYIIASLSAYLLYFPHICFRIPGSILATFISGNVPIFPNVFWVLAFPEQDRQRLQGLFQKIKRDEINPSFEFFSEGWRN